MSLPPRPHEGATSSPYWMGFFVGGVAAASFFYGITCSQIIYYFRRYSYDWLWLKFLVIIILVLETFQAIFLSYMGWYNLSVALRLYEGQHFYCSHWSGFAYILTAELCCILVESFYFIRIRRLTTRKLLSTIILIPLVVGWVLVLVYAIKFSVGHECNPRGRLDQNRHLLLAGTICTCIADSIMACTMALMLFRRRERCSIEVTNSPKVLMSLSFCSLFTGLAMCLSTLTLVIMVIFHPTRRAFEGLYLVHSKVYACCLMMSLNNRGTYRKRWPRVVDLELVLGTPKSSRRPSESQQVRALKASTIASHK